MTAPEIPAERVPTTDLIREQYAAAVDEYGTFDGWHLTDAEARVAFDAWLAQHDAEVRRQVLEVDGDGYHTHAELYRYRMLYNARAAKAWADQGTVVKSWRHSDGEECFGGGWFVVVANLHPFGQVSNHYEAEHWDLFDVPAVEMAPEWDGHTPEQAADRLEAALRARATTHTDPEEHRP